MNYMVYEVGKFKEARFYDAEHIEGAVQSWGLDNLTEAKATVCASPPLVRGFLMFDLEWENEELHVRRR